MPLIQASLSRVHTWNIHSNYIPSFVTKFGQHTLQKRLPPRTGDIDTKNTLATLFLYERHLFGICLLFIGRQAYRVIQYSYNIEIKAYYESPFAGGGRVIIRLAIFTNGTTANK